MVPPWWVQVYQLELELEAEIVKVCRSLRSNFRHIPDQFFVGLPLGLFQVLLVRWLFRRLEAEKFSNFRNFCLSSLESRPTVGLVAPGSVVSLAVGGCGWNIKLVKLWMKID